MNDDEKTGMFWEQNAEAWTVLSEKGYDIYRDHVNTPAFLKMLPAVAGLRGLDVGCGEGPRGSAGLHHAFAVQEQVPGCHDTRILAGRRIRLDIPALAAPVALERLIVGLVERS